MRRQNLFILIFSVVLLVFGFGLNTLSHAAGIFDGNSVPNALDANTNTGAVNGPVHIIDSANSWMHYFGTVIGTLPFSANPQTQSNYQKHTLLARTQQGIELAFAKPPASTGQYIAYMRNKMGIVQPAYAQGIGFSGLSPIIDVWRAFRNIAYGFLIVVLVVIGFMIIFRWKIDPRTVVTIQSALPRLIVTLILITFSYAIVGLMIDVMYLSIYVTLLALGKAGNVDLVQNMTGGSISNLYGTLMSTGLGSVQDIVNFFLGANPDVFRVVTAAIGGAVGAFAGGGFAPLGLAIGGGAGAALPEILVGALVGIALLFLLVRIFLTLLNAWIQVFIALIFGPLQLMLGAIPGVNTFGGWFKNLVANLAAFPITIILIMIGSYLAQSGTSGTLWTPPGFGGTPNGQGVAGLIGLGVAMIIPGVVSNFKQAIKATSPIPAGPGAIISPFGSALGAGMQMMSTQYYLSQGPLGGLLGRTPVLGRFFGGKR